jgi:hypothetical protein
MRDMVVAIIAAALGVLIAAAMLGIPRLIVRRSHPYREADAEGRAYESETGRSSAQIEQDNAAVEAGQQNRPQEASGSGAST